QCARIGWVEKLKRLSQFVRRGKSNLDPRRARIVDDKGMKIVQILRNQESCEGVSREQALARPIANQAGQSVQVIVKAALQRRRKQVRTLENAPDLHLFPIQAR